MVVSGKYPCVDIVSSLPDWMLGNLIVLEGGRGLEYTTVMCVEGIIIPSTQGWSPWTRAIMLESTPVCTMHAYVTCMPHASQPDNSVPVLCECMFCVTHSILWPDVLMVCPDGVS